MRLSSEPRSARFNGMTGFPRIHDERRPRRGTMAAPSPISRAFVPPCSTIAAGLATVLYGTGPLSDQTFSRTGTLASLRCDASHLSAAIRARSVPTAAAANSRAWGTSATSPYARHSSPICDSGAFNG